MIRVPVVVKIALLTVLATGFYTYVGQLVPQKEVHPPEVIELAEDVSTAELAEIGRTIFEGKGLCTTCHTIGKSGALRFPDLAGIATRAGNRNPGYSALEYMAESLYEPETYIVEGFAGGMPVIDEPPVGLTDEEIRTVLAYLQTLGGAATITMETPIPFAGGAGRDVGGVVASSEQPAGGEAVAAATGPAALLEQYRCGDCHYLDRPGRLQAASLADVGARLDREAILAAVASHEQMEGGQQVAESGYYDQVSLSQARGLADYLAGQGVQQ